MDLSHRSPSSIPLSEALCVPFLQVKTPLRECFNDFYSKWKKKIKGAIAKLGYLVFNVSFLAIRQLCCSWLNLVSSNVGDQGNKRNQIKYSTGFFPQMWPCKYNLADLQLSTINIYLQPVFSQMNHIYHETVNIKGSTSSAENPIILLLLFPFSFQGTKLQLYGSTQREGEIQVEM